MQRSAYSIDEEQTYLRLMRERKISKEYVLYRACKYGWPETVARLSANRRVSLHSHEGENSRTCLFIACQWEREDLDPDFPSLNNRTPLMACCIDVDPERGAEIARLLLGTGRVDASRGDQIGYTVTHLAAHSGNVEILKMLPEKAMRAALNLSVGSGGTPLCIAIDQKRLEATKWLLAQPGIDVNTPCGFEHTALHGTCKTNWAEGVALLLEDGRADLNACTSTGLTPLMLACIHDSSDVISLLLADKRTSVGPVQPQGTDALTLACENNSIGCMKLLMDDGRFDVNRRAIHLEPYGAGPMHNPTAFLQACVNGNFFAIRYLLRRKETDVGATTLFGRTALHMVVSGSGPVRHNCYGMCMCEPVAHRARDLLDDERVDVNARTQDGETAFFQLCGCERAADAVRYFACHPRVDVNIPAANGRTPLHRLILQANYKAIVALLASGKVEHAARRWWHEGEFLTESELLERMPLREGATVDERDRACDLLRLRERDERGAQAAVLRARRIEGIYPKSAATLYALVIFCCDGLFRLTDAGDANEGQERARRFFRVASRLPLEMQMHLCSAVFFSGDYIIKRDMSEAAFRRLAMGAPYDGCQE